MSEKILIVEDELDVAELLAHHLHSEGFSVDIVSNGRAAFTAIKSQLPADLVTGWRRRKEPELRKQFVCGAR
jgi:DNA-binding response OmpR family regulator